MTYMASGDHMTSMASGDHMTYMASGDHMTSMPGVAGHVDPILASVEAAVHATQS